MTETVHFPYVRSPDQDAVSAVRHPVVVAGAGPVGLVSALDLAQQGVPVVILDDADTVSRGARAICFSRRTLEVLDRIGCGAEAARRGVAWNTGIIHFGTAETHRFELSPDAGDRYPAFVNLPQFALEEILIGRLRALAAEGTAIELRGRHRISAVGVHADHVRLEIDTPEGPYSLQADWLIAADGANSPVRRMLGLEFPGRAYDDVFLIADIQMEADIGTERRFWFDPPFNPGQSAMLHRQPDDLWRIDLQLGPGVDAAVEQDRGRAEARLRTMIDAILGPDVVFTVRDAAIYSYHCRRMERFVHGRVLFAGDAAHQLSPFGARGANSGMQDADNLGWKLAAVIRGAAPAEFMESYNWERVCAADENLVFSSRASDFVTPKSQASRLLRDAVLALARRQPFARPMVNSGRLSVPSVYDDGPLNGPDAEGLPEATRPGAPACDADLGEGWLLDHLGGRFVLLAIDAQPPGGLPASLETLTVSTTDSAHLAERYLGAAPSALYLVRPDQHVAARWRTADAASVKLALAIASGRTGAA